MDVLQLVFTEKTDDTHRFLAKGEPRVKEVETSGWTFTSTYPTESKSPRLGPETKPSRQWLKGTYDERLPWAAARSCSHSQPCQGAVVPKVYKLACSGCGSEQAQSKDVSVPSNRH